MDIQLSDLPEDVLIVIFSFLEVEDKLQACLVCKQWLEIMNCKFLLRDINVCLNSFEAIHLLASANRKFFNYTFGHLSIDERICNCFQALDYVESVKFLECWASSINDALTVSQKMFVNLKELTVVNYDHPFNFMFLFPCLSNLKTLEISGNNFCDFDLMAFQKSIRNLERLTIHCSIVSDSRVYRRFYPPRLTYEENPSMDILSIIGIKKFTSRFINTLSELSLNKISATALKELSGLEGLNLRKFSISIQGYNDDCYESLIKLFSTQNELKALQLKNMVVPKNLAKAILTKLTMLEELSIDCSIIYDEVICFFELPQLCLIDIHATRIGDNQMIGHIESKKLKYLNLCSVPCIDCHLLSTKEIQNLSLLKLQCCRINDTDLQTISLNLTKLQFLDVSNNLHITDEGVTGLGGEVCSMRASIKNLKSLRFLDISKCSVTEKGLMLSVEFHWLHTLIICGYELSEGCISFLKAANLNLKNVIVDSKSGKALLLRQQYFNHLSDYLSL